MSSLNTDPSLNDLANAYEHSSEILAAIKIGVFYVVATPVGNSYCIGTLDQNIPGLIPTREEAQKELDELNQWQEEAVLEGERDEDDDIQAEIFKARWDSRGTICLYALEEHVCDDSSLLCTDTVASLTGA